MSVTTISKTYDFVLSMAVILNGSILELIGAVGMPLVDSYVAEEPSGTWVNFNHMRGEVTLGRFDPDGRKTVHNVDLPILTSAAEGRVLFLEI